jgi:hypothetical protein
MVEHLKVQFTYWVGAMVEPAYASLSVEHLKVQFTYWVGAMVEPAYASLTVEPLTDLMVEHLKVLWSSASGPYGRATKVPLLNSRACLRILSMAALSSP